MRSGDPPRSTADISRPAAQRARSPAMSQPGHVVSQPGRAQRGHVVSQSGRAQQGHVVSQPGRAQPGHVVSQPGRAQRGHVVSQSGRAQRGHLSVSRVVLSGVRTEEVADASNMLWSSAIQYIRLRTHDSIIIISEPVLSGPRVSGNGWGLSLDRGMQLLVMGINYGEKKAIVIQTEAERRRREAGVKQSMSDETRSWPRGAR